MIAELAADVIPLSADRLTYWRREIDRARQVRKEVASRYGWKENLERYDAQKLKNDRGALVADINIGADFRDVERKKAALFNDTPEVVLTPDEPALASGVLLQQELLNGFLGSRHANIKPTVLQAIFDCLCPSGVSPITVGYSATLRPTTQKVMVLDPMSGLPQVMEQTVNLPIAEEYFAAHSSPWGLLIPADQRSTDYQRGSWLGTEWRRPASQVRRQFDLPDDWKPSAGDAENPHAPNTTGVEEARGDFADPPVSGVDVWYRASLDAQPGEIVHPELIRYLVLVDGHDQPLVHRDSPHQNFGPDGRLTPDSMVGFPIKPLVLRDLTDAAWVASDCAMTAALTMEVNKYRTQNIIQREGNRQIIAFDAAKIDPTAKDKIVDAYGVTWVPLGEGALAQGVDAVMTQVPQTQLGRENYVGVDYIERDREKILGIGDNQLGLRTQGKKTATESSIMQRNSEARFEQERQRVLAWYLDVVRSFDCLILRYCDEQMAATVLGPQKAKQWAQAKPSLVGGYRYEIQVDSGRYVDVEANRAFWMKVYNLTAQDPNVRRTVTLKKLSSVLGLDPSEWIVDQLPEKPPDLKASLTFKSEDLNPLTPQFSMVVNLLRQAGWKISPEDVQLAQQQAKGMGLIETGMDVPVSGVGADPNTPPQPPGHGGAQPSAATVNRRTAEQTGNLPGGGAEQAA